MKVQQAVDFHLQYHQANSKKNTVKTCEFVLFRFSAKFAKRDLASILQEEILTFLMSLTKNNKQATKRNRYSVLSSFYNFCINTALPALTNPCNTAVIKKIFRRPQAIQWQIVDKEVVDEIIFFNDGSAAPLDYKYAEYKNKIYRTHRYQLVFYAKLIQENFNVEVNKGYVVYTRSKNKLVEIELKKADFTKLGNMVRKIVAIIYKCHYPAPTRYKKSCLDCCYKNICDSSA